MGQFLRRQDESAADGVVGFRGELAAIRADGGECQPVWMTRQRRQIEMQIRFRRECHPRQSGRLNPVIFPHARLDRVGPVGVHRRWIAAHETQNDGAVGAVTLPGVRQRPIQRTAHPLRRVPVPAQQIEKPRRRHHRSHGMGTGGTDADLEQLEDADEHDAPSPRIPVAARAAGYYFSDLASTSMSQISRTAPSPPFFSAT